MDRHTLYELFVNFDVDRYVNPWIPHNRLYILPKPAQHFLGYRQNGQKEPPTLVQWVSTFIATLAGLCLVGGLYATAPGIAKYNPPAMIASLGASAVLDYNTVRSPLSQPRNSIVGHTLAAIIGVCIAKLFQLNPTFFANYGWVAGAVGCACASLVMSMTNTIHPPGGATAILASTEAQVIALGWIFIPLVLLASCLMVCVACLFNNVFRQYPVFWWTPDDVGHKLRNAKKEHGQDDKDDGGKLEKQHSLTDSERTLRREPTTSNVDFIDGLKEVQILPHRIQMPAHVEVTAEEVLLLERLQERIRTQT